MLSCQSPPLFGIQQIVSGLISCMCQPAVVVAQLNSTQLNPMALSADTLHFTNLTFIFAEFVCYLGTDLLIYVYVHVKV